MNIAFCHHYYQKWAFKIILGQMSFFEFSWLR